MFDPGKMADDRPGPAADRLPAARLTGICMRHARWGNLTDDQAAAAVAELREVAGGRADLLAEVATLPLTPGGLIVPAACRVSHLWLILT